MSPAQSKNTSGAHSGLFLVLSPVASSNYPLSPTSNISPTNELGSPVMKPAGADDVQRHRRMSSVSSASSSSSATGPFKFLKLGPVYNGKGDGTDFAEADE
ncbi:uncharacterized protein K452DRAFT_299905 [Aplosporella prunicola CBS 121167]|uniref:Uncharacterized protein n=1 Tax=Aplosporella prunicola CBS 121167 TaxID=1176127 RepID=A0A6A6BBS8_9PEZI|nr:uncharacterized protein K452DRAFT_299905 [Aplosporella prunicola CBS 121167]KAF2139931.1 hypothetical protein K452DRAFT_299905 [Aplosporella prunicola CBS 121167]